MLSLFGEGSFENGRPRSKGWKNFERRWTRRVWSLEISTIFMDVKCVSSLMQNLKISPLLFRSERIIFDMIFKRLFQEKFEHLQIVTETFESVSLCPIKWLSFKVFEKLHESPLLIASTVKAAVLDNILQLKVPEKWWKVIVSYQPWLGRVFRGSFWGGEEGKNTLLSKTC